MSSTTTDRPIRRRPSRRTCVGLAAAMAAAAAPILLPAPALAGVECTSSQHKEISTPGWDTDLYVKVCGSGGGGSNRGAFVIVSWSDGGDSANDGDRKFDKLRVQARVERHGTSRASKSWSIAGKVNRNKSGTWTSPWVRTGGGQPSGGWTGDGAVTYDVDRDGAGSRTWQLKGSPVQS